MKKITNFAVVFTIMFSLMIIVFNIIFDLFGTEITATTFITNTIVLLLFACIHCLSLAYIILYEIVTCKKFIVGKIKEGKIYKILLLFRFLCILAIIAYILIRIYFSIKIDNYVLLIVGTCWSILAIYSAPFEENLSTTNLKRTLLISAIVVLLTVVIFFCEYAINIFL